MDARSVLSRPLRWRFVAVGCVLFTTTLLWRNGYAGALHPFASFQGDSHMAFDSVSARTSTAGRKSYVEDGITLSAYTAPFTCNLQDLPPQARMATYELENYIMVVHGFQDIVSDWLYKNGGWEKAQLEQMAAYMDAIATVEPSRDGYLDLGANIGAHAIPLAARKYKVHAFEPTHANHVLVRCSLALSGIGNKFRLNAFALGDKPDTICMKSSNSNFGDSRVVNASTCEYKDQSPVGTMDHYWRQVLHRHQKIGVMKMDIQGFEINAMRQASAFFASDEAPAVVFFEYDIDLLTGSGRDPLELAAFFHDRGYRTWRALNTLEEVTMEKYPFFGKKEGWPKDPDMVAVKTEWLERLRTAGYLFEGSKIRGRVRPAAD
ncbi:uncharacterized protein CLAFUR5_14584 [Fulvia fulva]|uniref:Methyltransferase FkbM domain-containing protein n=1 Tax=Passalora fulva TaxID=5499 RepID=A0A9Q8UWB2_PASFU|nr:uncharacterized protein CLAFUR5_14584 [Fulvia fulva]UJO24864.1 hypothetical protein CLAFUR5_14584 [Fulvia fulva]